MSDTRWCLLLPRNHYRSHAVFRLWNYNFNKLAITFIEMISKPGFKTVNSTNTLSIWGRHVALIELCYYNWIWCIIQITTYSSVESNVFTMSYYLLLDYLWNIRYFLQIFNETCTCYILCAFYTSLH